MTSEKSVKKVFRQYNHRTNRLIRHKFWRGGRRAFDNLVQLHDEFNNNTFSQTVKLIQNVTYINQQIISIQKFIKMVSEFGQKKQPLIITGEGDKH